MYTEHLDFLLGDLIVHIYDEFLEQYRDSDLASVATAAMVQELLADLGSEDELGHASA